MKVLITGATGFTGSYTVPLFIERGYEVRCLVRPSSNRRYLPEDKVEFAEGDLSDANSLERALIGVDALVNIASLGFGHAGILIPVLQQSKVRRAIFVSTTSIFTNLNAGSKSIRLRSEELIKSSELDYTILRPTMIYGSSRDRNICRLIRFVKRSPVIPIFGNGEYFMQPVYIGDVAKALVNVLENPVTIGKEYNISGADELSYNEVVDTVARLMNKKIRKFHIPHKPVVAGLSFFEKLSLPLPIKGEQILRLNEDKAFTHEHAREDFAYDPLSFEQGIQKEMIEMGVIKNPPL